MKFLNSGHPRHPWACQYNFCYCSGKDVSGIPHSGAMPPCSKGKLSSEGKNPSAKKIFSYQRVRCPLRAKLSLDLNNNCLLIKVVMPVYGNLNVFCHFKSWCYIPYLLIWYCRIFHHLSYGKICFTKSSTGYKNSKSFI